MVRYHGTDGTDHSDRIGYWTTNPRDAWKPRPYQGRDLPRLSESQVRARLRRYDDRIEQGKQDKPTASDWSRFVDGFLDRTGRTIRDSSLKELRVSLETFGELADAKTPRAGTQQTAKRFVQQAKATGRNESTINK